MDIFELLGIDADDPDQRRALAQVHGDGALLDDLVRIRKDRMTQQQVADQLGVSQSAVAKIESGDRDPRLSTLGRYASAIGVLVRHEVDTGVPERGPIVATHSGAAVRPWHTSTHTAPRIRLHG